MHTVVDVIERTRHADELHASERLFRATFDQAAVGMGHLAPDGKWLRVNDKLCEMVGYCREEMLCLTFEDITHPEDLETDLGYISKMLAGGISSYRIDKRYFRKDGRVVWGRLNRSIIREPSGQPHRLISVIEDIISRKLAELVPEPLTSRELDVLHLISRGLTNPQISRTLAYSMSTIKLRVQRILAKLGVENRTQAAERAVAIGLIPPPR